jgi:aspartate racemase
MKDNNYLRIGVLGGMGPEASAAFYLRIIKLFQTELGAQHNFEYPEMMIHNIPSPDTVEAGVDEELKESLLNSVDVLEKAGMQLLAIPCNSAHVHIGSVVEAASATVMNILEETARAVHEAGATRVLLLGTKSTLEYGIYPPYFDRYNIGAVIPEPDHQDVVTRAIMAVCDGSLDARTKQDVLDVINHYQGIEGVVLGCTEIPLIVNQNDMSVTCFDTTEILARATFARCQLNSD